MSDFRSSDCISRQAAIEALSTPHGILYPIRTIEQLPSAQPERKKGRWIIEKDATGATYGRCSVCGIKQYGGHMNFCYECGADMRGEQDE